jgi:hypothetical protein
MSESDGVTGTDFVNTIGGAVRDNPLPAALIGMGLVWLLTGGKSPMKAAFSAAGEGLSTLGAQTTEGVRFAGSSVTDAAASAVEGVRARASVGNMRSTLSGLLQRQPLLLGALGLAIGAGVGASLPISEIETEYLGDASAEFQAKARAVANEQRERVSDVATGVQTAIAEGARVEGLTPDKLKSTAVEVEQRIMNLADYAGTVVREKLQ